MFAALALHEHPAWREKLRAGDDEYTGLFVQEVRRFYPFAPFVGAKVRAPFDWRGYHFRKGALVLLDVYGTNRDGRQWERPDEFWPERFRQWDQSSYNFIPQGGGDYHHGHRCPGEWITIEATKLAVNFLTRHVTYEVPPQDLRFPLSRIPTFPRSGFVITQVAARRPFAAPAGRNGYCPSKQWTAIRPCRPPLANASLLGNARKQFQMMGVYCTQKACSVRAADRHFNHFPFSTLHGPKLAR